MYVKGKRPQLRPFTAVSFKMIVGQFHSGLVVAGSISVGIQSGIRVTA